MSGNRIEDAAQRIEAALARIATHADRLAQEFALHETLRREVKRQIAALDGVIAELDP